MLFYAGIVNSIAKNDENKTEFAEIYYRVNSKTMRIFLRIFNSILLALPLFSDGFEAKGGRLAFYLLKRRLRKTTEIILPICTLYLRCEDDENNRRQVTKVINDISGIIHTFDNEKVGTGGIISIITGILGIVLAQPIYNALNDIFQHNPYSSVIAILIMFVIVAAIELYVVKRIFPQLIGYFRVIIIFQFNTKEIDVYDSLKPLEQFILNCNDNLRQLTKKSFLTFASEIAGELKRKRKH